jgi:hypothetical protein
MYYAMILRSCHVWITCHRSHSSDIYQEQQAEGTACSYGTYTLVRGQRQTIVNALTRVQGPKVHMWKRLVSKIRGEQVKTAQHALLCS